MNLALWIVTVILAVVLLVSTSKAVVPRERIAAVGHSAEWVMDFSPAALRAIAALELLAVAGLILPAVLDITPVLVPVAAVGVVLLMIGAATVRVRYGSPKAILGDAVYLLLAAFVAWGRFGPESFS